MDYFSRREAMRLLAGAGVGGLLPIRASRGQSAFESSAMLARAIPSSGEKLPVMGLGSWQTLDVELRPDNGKVLGDVLSRFAELGGKLIDSSPMYGRSEEVIGTLATERHLHDQLFLATKVWTRGKESGIRSMERSFERLQSKRIDLMQVHNLVDLSTHLATMREWKAQGRFRYLGVTHYNASALAEVEKVLKSEKLDFLQINYSIMEPQADQRILPLAQERAVAVIVNRPFGGGDLFARIRTKPLPDWAAEFECKSWAQFFLKWIIAYPAVTCVIPATNNLRHAEDDLQAGRGRLPDAEMRRRMVELVTAG